MVHILHIETSGKVCSAAVSQDADLKSFKYINDGEFRHVEQLHLFAADVLTEAGIGFKDLSAIAVSIGPGSYTGLRVGVSAAKGWCYTLGIPFISVSTLAIMAKKIKTGSPFAEKFIPMIDARRDEVYLQEFNKYLKPLGPPAAVILSEYSVDPETNVAFGGDGCEKSKKYFHSDHFRFHPEIFPSADSMVELGFENYCQQKFEDTAYVEPFYLKEFYTVKKL